MDDCIDREVEYREELEKLAENVDFLRSPWDWFCAALVSLPLLLYLLWFLIPILLPRWFEFGESLRGEFLFWVLETAGAMLCSGVVIILIRQKRIRLYEYEMLRKAGFSKNPSFKTIALAGIVLAVIAAAAFSCLQYFRAPFLYNWLHLDAEGLVITAVLPTLYMLIFIGISLAVTSLALIDYVDRLYEQAPVPIYLITDRLIEAIIDSAHDELTPQPQPAQTVKDKGETGVLAPFIGMKALSLYLQVRNQWTANLNQFGTMLAVDHLIRGEFLSLVSMKRFTNGCVKLVLARKDMALAAKVGKDCELRVWPIESKYEVNADKWGRIISLTKVA
nr:hypothetical protein [Bacillota bacterium]